LPRCLLRSDRRTKGGGEMNGAEGPNLPAACGVSWVCLVAVWR
jgi:hypothetical protein